jgi:glycosyltransferase involved in cell wall biosynthesis
MKIAFLGAEGIPYPAAFARYTEEVGKRLVEKGHEVIVYCPKRYVQDDSNYLGMKRIVLPSLNTKHLDTITHTFLSVLDVAARKVDIVSIHGTGPSLWAFVPRLYGAKSVVHFHTSDWKRDKWGHFAKFYLKLSERFAVYLPNRTTTVSRLLQDYCLKKFHRHVTYVPPAINSPVFRQPSKLREYGLSKDDYVLFLGRLVPEKGCHHLIKAFEKVNTEKKLVIAGGADRSDEYVKSLKQTRDERILFVGHVQGELWEELFSNAYLYVHPSEVEGLPAALLQAMSYGNYVLVSDIPENLEAIGGFGYTFKNKNYLDLRDKVQCLLDNPGLLHQRSEQQKKYIYENYNWDRVTDALEELYFSVLKH